MPDTVHHVVFKIDPKSDELWKNLRNHIKTDDVHAKDQISMNNPSKESLSEAIKILKGEYIVKAIDSLKMDQAIIFCRTKLDCDNLESYFNKKSEGICIKIIVKCFISHKFFSGQTNSRNQYSCVCLHSDRKPQERKDNLKIFKDGKVKFLICTDVAARGIDVKGKKIL